MSMPSPVDFSDYKKFIRSYLETAYQKRGLRTQMAEAMKTHRSHVTHLITSEVQLTLEQADALARFMGLQPLEVEYFVQLVSLARAGTPSLRSLISRNLKNTAQAIKKERLKLPSETTVLPQQAFQYFGQWWSMAVHLAVSSWKKNDMATISSRLGISRQTVARTIHELHEAGMLKKTNKGWVAENPSVDLSQSPQLVWIHAATWRNWVLGRHRHHTELPETRYSGALSMTSEDAVWVREQIVDLIGRMRSRVATKKGEQIFYLGVDFLDMTQSDRTRK